MESILFQMFLTHPIEMSIILMQGIIIALFQAIFYSLKSNYEVMLFLLHNWFFVLTLVYCFFMMKEDLKQKKEENFWSESKNMFKDGFKNFSFKKDVLGGYKDIKKEIEKEELAKKRARQKRKERI